MLSCLLDGQNAAFFSYNVVCRCTKWIASYAIILFRKRTSRKYEYDMKVAGKPDKIGFVIPPEEWDLECSEENQGTNEMFCFGVNSYGECLALQIARECACDSSSFLFLKINGHTYTFPSKYSYVVTNDKRVFGNNRFYMQCLAPFRRWKIFFNGILREVCPSENIDQLIHVRISLIWVASSGVFDFISDYSSSNIVDILSRTKWNSCRPPIKKILSILNEYHQPGMLHGTFQLGKDSQREIRLWGCRRHAFGTRMEDMESFIDLFGNSENGHLFYLKIFKLDDHAWNSSGYVMLPNGYLKAIHILSTKRMVNGTKNTLSFRTKAEEIHYNISAIFYEYGKFAGKQMDRSVIVSVVDTIVNGVWGSGVAIERICIKRKLHEKCELIMSMLNLKKISKETVVDTFSTTLEDRRSLSKCFSGNFGSNLAKVYQMKDHTSGYDMENALVITTSGYEEYISSLQETIKNLEDHVYKYDTDELLPLCERIVEEISNSHFPPSLHDAVSDHLNNLTNAKRASFCIYPSFCGEGENVQLLEAYLLMYRNVCGLSEIIKCVKKCWASQFSFVAIQCKRSTGQLLNLPMAVIIQKNVSFKTSGVISTCESSTGNPGIMEIREELNKSSGEIRIIQLLRNSNDSVKIETSTTVNLDNNPSEDNKEDINATLDEEKCLSEDQILFLGKLACKIEKFFRFPLCIEWCFKKKKFCIIQVRAITLSSADTKSEMLHYWDSYLRSEDEWFSVYSTGEGFVGAVSPLGMNLLNFCTEVFMSKLKDMGIDLWAAPEVPYFPKCLFYSHYHVMYCLADGIIRLKFLNTFFKTLSYVMNLKIEEDEVLYELISQRQEPSNSYFRIMWKSIGVMFSFAFKPEKIEKKFSDYDLNSEDKSTSSELFYEISNHYEDLTEAFINFMYYTYKAVLWNMLVFYVLEKINRKEKDGIYNDFNFLMSACSKLKEGDIPYDILALSKRIVANIEPSTFKKMPLEDAMIWLEDTEIDKKIKFSDFLDKHGHRCYKEVDVFQKCWCMDPIIVVQVLQYVVPVSSHSSSSQFSSINPVFNQLSVMPNFLQRLILKFTIPRCCEAIKQAKSAKSLLLKIVSHWRKAFYKLANCAVKEFRIPFPEALFFLSLNEIEELLTSRSPDLVKRALKCWEIHADVDKYMFPVITIEHPIPLNGNYYDKKRLNIGSCLKGLPMSRGTVVGTAVVIRNFNEATPIKKGAVLITESPSIIWSLYFPAIGGFAADLGGVLSEGATAARDYGIPCVIGLIRATKVIKTGDRIFLDANVGIVRRISSK